MLIIITKKSCKPMRLQLKNKVYQFDNVRNIKYKK